MKKCFGFIVLVISLFITKHSTAQFEGVLKVKVEAIELPTEMKDMEAMFNSTVTTHLKGTKARVDMKTAMGDMIMIIDSAKKEIVTCMDMGGQKMAMVTPLDDTISVMGTGGQFEDGKFELTGETKTIAGHPCKKAVWKGKGKDAEIVDIWYATDVDYEMEGFGDLPGMPMEYIYAVNGMKMKYQVLEVTKTTVDDKLFDIPEGYVRKTAAELGVPEGK